MGRLSDQIEDRRQNIVFATAGQAQAVSSVRDAQFKPERQGKKAVGLEPCLTKKEVEIMINHSLKARPSVGSSRRGCRLFVHDEA